MQRRAMSWVAVVAALVFAAACGGGSSPSAPSGAASSSVAIKGVVLGSAAGTAAPVVGALSVTQSANTSSSITVTIEGSGITTTVSANGTFELTGVPGGTFTLVFTQNGVEIGRVQVTAGAGSEVKIVVQVQGPTTLIVIQLEVDEGNDASPSPSPSPSAGTSTCVIDGGKVGSGIELEGNVSSGTSSAFKMAVNGERSSTVVDVSAASASFKCNGGDKLSDDACKATVKAGVKVHVRGTLMTCTTSAASVTATEVMVQKD